MTLRLAPRTARIAPFQVMELVARARQLESDGRDIIHLEVGEPDFPTAQPVLDAAQAFLARGSVRYTPSRGLPELQQAISAYYLQRFGIHVSSDRILITSGASAGLQLLLAALVAPGDVWLQPDPGYPCNRHFVSLFEGIPQLLPTSAANKFQPTPDDVRAAWTPATRGLIVATPSNPTGTTLSLPELAALRDEVARHGGHLIVDEIYQGLNFDEPPVTALSLGEDVFVANSFSKYFGMTGWRLGWIVAPTAALRALETLAQNLYICAPTVAQHAALAAFTPAAMTLFEARRTEFAARRNLLCAGLERLGLRLPAAPSGAFYAYADVSQVGTTSAELSRRLLEEAGVAATPGHDFGTQGAEQHLRFAYTTDTQRLAQALERIEAILK
jgi:aspartate/methionine/tyrosine aminotransferase